MSFGKESVQMTERGANTGINEWACLTTGEETGRKKEGKGGRHHHYFILLHVDLHYVHVPVHVFATTCTAHVRARSTCTYRSTGRYVYSAGE